MSRSMNSIIFEGVITELTFDGEGEAERCAFVLAAWDIHVKEGEDDIQTLEDDVRVEVRGEGLVGPARRYARIGRKVKVVGKIARAKIDNDLYIVAEHTNYWPRLPGDEW
jgi:hypothetical protein